MFTISDLVLSGRPFILMAFISAFLSGRGQREGLLALNISMPGDRLPSKYGRGWDPSVCSELTTGQGLTSHIRVVRGRGTRGLYLVTRHQGTLPGKHKYKEYCVSEYDM